MKKVGLMLSMVLVLALGLGPAWAEDWTLYDNFESGSIDPALWTVTTENGTVEIENGQLKVTHPAGISAVLNGLNFARDPEKILAVKFTVTMASVTNDLRARLHGWVGQVEGRPIKGAIQSRPNPNRNYHHVWLGEFSDPETWVIDLFWAYFRSPVQIIGQAYTQSMRFDPEDIRWSIDGLGEIQYNDTTGGKVESLTDLTYTQDKFLGTRSYGTDSEGVVYFDDVYVIWSTPTESVGTQRR